MALDINNKQFTDNSFDRLMNFSSDINNILKENYELKQEVLRLREVEKEYNELCYNTLERTNTIATDTIKMILDSLK